MKIVKITLLVLVLIAVAKILLGIIPGNITNNKQVLTIGTQTLTIDVVDTPAERERGLSGRKELCWECGMFFIFENKQIYTFWMPEMYFDIDIIWISDIKVVDITYGAKKPDPANFENPKEIYRPKVPIDKVLEVNSGWVKEKGIEVGDEIKYR